MPRLVIKQGPGIGRDFNLGPAPCVVGRDAGADFVLEDHRVSRRHFQIQLEAGRYVMADLGSTNGVAVNGKRVKRAALSDGDLIAAGGSQVTFVQKDLFGGSPAPTRRRRR
jgi:pSer/pThr/pTyr-binding forkhead associated (FHA) protein